MRAMVLEAPRLSLRATEISTPFAGRKASLVAGLRPEFRWYGSPDAGKNVVGFRCVLVPASD